MWLKGHNFNLTGMTFDLKFSCTKEFRSEVLNTKGLIENDNLHDNRAHCQQKHNLARQNTFLVMTGFLSLGDEKGTYWTNSTPQGWQPYSDITISMVSRQ